MDELQSDAVKNTDQIVVRLPTELRAAIDEWARTRRRETGENVSMSEAVRMLLAQALGLDADGKPLSKKGAKR